MKRPLTKRSVSDMPEPPLRPFFARWETSDRSVWSASAVEKLHSRYRHQRGRLLSTPLISTTCWLRGLDLNQRPLGYEGNLVRKQSRLGPIGAYEHVPFSDSPHRSSRSILVDVLHSPFIDAGRACS
jgi:hypothetical protein